MSFLTSRKTIYLSFGMRLLIGLGLAAASAALLTLSMPPYGIWPFAFVGLLPMVLAQHRILPKKFSSLAPALAIGGVVAFYILPAFLGLPGTPWYMRALPLAFFLLVFLTDQNTANFHNRTSYRWFVLSGSFGWVGLELIRSFIPVLGTWGFLGYAFFKQPWLIQPVSIFGVFGMSLISLLFGLSLGLGVLACFDRYWVLDETVIPVPLPHARQWLIIGSSALAAWMILSLVLFMPAKKPAKTVRAAGIQSGFKTLWNEDELKTNTFSNKRWNEIYNQVFEGQVAETRAVANEQPDLIVWAEGAIKFDPKAVTPKLFKDLSAETNAHLIIPYFVGTRNEVTVISPEGDFLGVYGKDHPVIFVNESSSTGGTYPVYDTEIGRLGTIICYDLDFTDTARKVARNGAQIIAVPSGDFPGISDKHYAHVVFRAVENRVSMIKVDRSYDSAIIDPYGRILDQVVSNDPVRATIMADIPVINANPLQRTLGDWIGWISLIGMIVFSGLEIVTRKKER